MESYSKGVDQIQTLYHTLNVIQHGGQTDDEIAFHNILRTYIMSVPKDSHGAPSLSRISNDFKFISEPLSKFLLPQLRSVYFKYSEGSSEVYSMIESSNADYMSSDLGEIRLYTPPQAYSIVILEYFIRSTTTAKERNFFLHCSQKQDLDNKESKCNIEWRDTFSFFNDPTKLEELKPFLKKGFSILREKKVKIYVNLDLMKLMMKLDLYAEFYGMNISFDLYSLNHLIEKAKELKTASESEKEKPGTTSPHLVAIESMFTLAISFFVQSVELATYTSDQYNFILDELVTLCDKQKNTNTLVNLGKYLWDRNFCSHSVKFVKHATSLNPNDEEVFKFWKRICKEVTGDDLIDLSKYFIDVAKQKKDNDHRPNQNMTRLAIMSFQEYIKLIPFALLISKQALIIRELKELLKSLEVNFQINTDCIYQSFKDKVEKLLSYQEKKFQMHNDSASDIYQSFKNELREFTASCLEEKYLPIETASAFRNLNFLCKKKDYNDEHVDKKAKR